MFLVDIFIVLFSGENIWYLAPIMQNSLLHLNKNVCWQCVYTATL